MKLEGVDGARQSLRNCTMACFPILQFSFPECIAERSFLSRHQGLILVGSQNRAVDGKHAENESQKNCSCQISHNSVILFDVFSNNNSAIYFEKKKCQGKKQLLDKAGAVGMQKNIVFEFRSCFSWESRYISYCHFITRIGKWMQSVRFEYT